MALTYDIEGFILESKQKQLSNVVNKPSHAFYEI